MNHELVLIIHNVRSAHNVGALFRTADGAGVSEIRLTGYTPVPPRADAPYLTDAEKAFRKTALGAEASVEWQRAVSIGNVIKTLRMEGFKIVALEQSEWSIDYRAYRPTGKVALIVGNEVRGLDRKILAQCDTVIDLPMRGSKHSLNVSISGGIALYQITGRME